MTTPSRWGTEFVLNTTTASNQALPTITALSGGRFVVAWEDWSPSGIDTTGVAVRAQIFHVDGSRSGSEFLFVGTLLGDWISGFLGQDQLWGGVGDDIHVLASPGDVVAKGSNAGIDQVNAAVSYVLGANVENLLLTGTAASPARQLARERHHRGTGRQRHAEWGRRRGPAHGRQGHGSASWR